MKITVIVPTYNEKENIEKTINALRGVFNQIKNHSMHVLITDANSPDGTADVVRKEIQRHENVHLIVEKEKRGLGAAYKDAMTYAFEKMNSDAIITFDADLSHDQNIIPAMIKKVEEGADYVCGTRYRKGGGMPEEWAPHRKLLSFGGNLFVRILYFGSGLSDFTSGYKLLTKKVYDIIKDKLDRHNGYTFAIAGNLEPLRAHVKVAEIPYKFKDRTAGKSKMGSEYFSNALIFVIKSRIEDFINSRFGKVFFAGGIGATSQLLAYALFLRALIENANIFNLNETLYFNNIPYHPTFLLSQFLAIEIGLTVSFIVNNTWAFGDNKLEGWTFFRRYLENHLVAAGAIVIQRAIGQVLATLFGVGFILNLMYQVIGIFVGLIWNFYFYKKVIWKVKK